MPDFSPLIAEATRLRGFPAKAKQAIQRSAATLGRRIGPEARRDIQAEYALPAARVNAGLNTRVTGEAVVLTGYARGIGLEAFGGKWPGRKSDGASAQVFTGKGRHTYGGTFIAKGKGGNRQIFERAFSGGKRAARLPIRTLYGPSVAAMLRKGDRPKRLDDIAQNILSSEIARLL